MVRPNEGASPSDRPSEEELKAVVAAGQSRGLLAVSATIEGVSITVSWGPPPKPRSTPGDIETRLQDMRTGKIVVAAGSASTENTQGWLAAANLAKSEADLVTLLSAERSKGLISATMVVNGVKITTSWAVRQR